MKVPHCCDATRQMYEQYYSQQQKGGGEFPVYVGRASQRGHGLGFLSLLGQRILPFLKKVAPHVIEAGTNIFQDVSKGKHWAAAALDHVPQAVGKLAFGQSGKGLNARSKRPRRQLKEGRRVVKKLKRDIFS